MDVSNILRSSWLVSSKVSVDNPGLLHQKWLPQEAVQKKIPFERMEEAACRIRTLYATAFKRHCRAAQGASSADVETDDVLAVGLGAASPLEVGLRLHPLFGTPIIPGSSLKGVAAHYCGKVWGLADPHFAANGSAFLTLFGSLEQTGVIRFDDAWILPESLPGCFVRDVMTPHHSCYYTDKSPVPSSDMDDPVPVSFLSVRGIFRLQVECVVKCPDAKRWEDLALQLLVEVLGERGVGGKTRSGYGRLHPISATGGTEQKQDKLLSPKPYETGTIVRVRRIENPKKPVWFSLLDGTGEGGLTGRKDLHQLPEIDEVVELKVAAYSKPNYNFVWSDDPSVRNSVQHSSSRRDPRQTQRRR